MRPAEREISSCGGELPGIALPHCCPVCGVVLNPSGLAQELYVCRCGHHFPLHADAWITLVADAGSWRECWTGLWPEDVPEWSRPKPYGAVLEQAASRGLNEAVRAGLCRIAGRPLHLAVFDFRFVGGTLGVVAGERLARTAEAAIADGLPLAVIASSGGARMQEGPQALMQLAKVNGVIAALHDAGVPYFTLLSYPTFGGTAASLALVADINLAEPGAAIGFTGPRIIEQMTHQRLPDDFQTAEFQLAHGQIDMIVERSELRNLLVSLYDMLTTRSASDQASAST